MQCPLLQDSAHFKNEQRKQAQGEAKIAKLKQQASQLTQAELAALDNSLQQRIACLEATRDLSRTWIHGEHQRVSTCDRLPEAL